MFGANKKRGTDTYKGITYEGLQNILMTFAVVWAILAPMTFEVMSNNQDEYSHKRDFEMILHKIKPFRTFVLEECERLNIDMVVPLGDITVDMAAKLNDDAFWDRSDKPEKESLVVCLKLWPLLDQSSVYAWTEMHRDLMWTGGPESFANTISAVLASAMLFGSLFMTVFLYASLTATPSRTNEAALVAWKRLGIPATILSVVLGIIGSIIVFLTNLTHTNGMLVGGITYFTANDIGTMTLIVIIVLSVAVGVIEAKRSMRAASVIAAEVDDHADKSASTVTST